MIILTVVLVIEVSDKTFEITHHSLFVAASSSAMTLSYHSFRSNLLDSSTALRKKSAF